MTFEPTRLKLARARRGMTKKQLSEASGLSPRTLSSLENDPTSSPTKATFDSLAAALRFPVEYFNLDATELPPPEAVSFRAMKSLTARQRDSALASAAIAIELSDWIEERFHLHTVEIPRLPDLSPDEAAESVRSEWKMGAGPVGNVIHHLEAHGVRVFSLTQDTKTVDAFSLVRDGKPYVFLNTFKTAERSRMDAAHELGHLVLHSEYNRSSSREIEREANTFASAFLLPAKGLIGRHSRFPDLAELIEAKKPWAVSLAAYVYRLHQLGQISDWHFRSLFAAMSQLGYRTDEPNSVARETSATITQVLAHLRRRGIGIDDVAQQLQVDRTDIDAVVFGLTITSVKGNAATTTKDHRKRTPELRIVR